MATEDSIQGLSSRRPNSLAVVAISVSTSALVSVIMVLVLQRTGWDPFAPEEPSTVRVPEVVGLTPQASDEVLRARDLLLVVAGREPNPERQAGLVARQSPMPGSRVQRNAEVEVVVSSGPPLAAVPAVLGKKLDGAKQMLQQVGLVVGDVQETGEGAPGTVVDLQPPPGTEVTAGSKVSLTVVPSGVEVPSVVGMSLRRAKASIEEVGLKVGRVSQRYVDYKPPYEVLKQDPEAGALLPPEGEVKLIANEGY